MEHPELLPKEQYDALVAALIATHPKDLICIIKQALIVRADTCDTISDTITTGQLTIPEMPRGDGKIQPPRPFTVVVREHEYTGTSVGQCGNHPHEVEVVAPELPTKPDPRFLTEDKAPITHNAVLFNYYDGYLIVVPIEGTSADHNEPYFEFWNGWFTTKRIMPDRTLERGATLDGSRMCSIEGARRYGHISDEEYNRWKSWGYPTTWTRD